MPRSSLSGGAERPVSKAQGGGPSAKDVGEYIQKMCVDHVQELGRKGILPKSK